ncbi:M15 family metallopeptidase [Lichenihabitans sp. PAMC28606]|uniref:M15 family metallopeptidase n=1 Tax=Lichenihabitans sp. PAMC28606 TaxID=2880932 RepID=UPI001D0A741F|nr:M15 family metallopeptidase [Lichenihabitans sp. PAMC28606]UDL95828.1 M15 family metallopeptidase [Lichenihabitans sp. PAMC28606]
MTNDPHAVVPPPGFVDLTETDGIVVDLRYASTNNFVGRVIYDGFDRLMLHEIAAAKLISAIVALRQIRPDLRLLVFDGFRPNRVQRLFWAVVRGTAEQQFVADPAIGSVHSFGLAVDLSLIDAAGRALDMGTDFDDFTERAEPRREADLLAQGALSELQVRNRMLLRTVMEAAGFLHLPIEWWHFDALPADQVRRLFSLIE